MHSSPCALPSTAVSSNRHGHAQRTQRHHPARHDDSGPFRIGWKLVAGASGASLKTPSSVCAFSKRATKPCYLSYSYGRGLMPDTFIDYKKQRFRWAYGAMQILRRHTRDLFSNRGSRLTNAAAALSLPGVGGWLPWVADGFNLVFNFAAARIFQSGSWFCWCRPCRIWPRSSCRWSVPCPCRPGSSAHPSPPATRHRLPATTTTALQAGRGTADLPRCVRPVAQRATNTALPDYAQPRMVVTIVVRLRRSGITAWFPFVRS
jgi:hypothetical protein